MLAEKNNDSSKLRLPGSRELDDFPDAHTAFSYRDNTTTWRSFRTRVFEWMAALSALETPDSGKAVAVYHRDTAEFVAILLAIWRLGKCAIVVPNTLTPTLERLALCAPIWAGEFPAGAQTLCEPDAAADVMADTAKHAYEALNDDAIALQVFTSGSSGEPELIAKSFRQIAVEADMLQSVWGEDVANQQSIASVSHHHMYGLSFHVFWPLLFGRTIFAEELAYLEALPGALALSSSVLIASPAHLAALPQSIDWSQCSDSLAMVFCAGAPLSQEASIDSRKKFACEPTEIYGSTEAGAVAWRHQHVDPQWQALPGVRCRLDGECLSLQSPALPDSAWNKTADKASVFSEQRFELLGRIDKIVKLAGKRVSLTAVEQQLANHPWVISSYVLPHSSRANRLCAVVQLHAEGLGVLIDQKSVYLQKALRQHLAGQVEALAIPRYWRFVRSMPVNAQGKTSQQELLALFSNEAQVSVGQEVHREWDANGSTLTLTLRVPANLKYLQGHFPGQPVLAGVVQIHWAVEYGAAEFGVEASQFQGMEAIKFQRVIVPGTVLALTLYFDVKSAKLHFRYSDHERVCSSGRILFQEKASE